MNPERIARHIPAWVASALCLAAILWLTLAQSPIGDVPVPLFPGADKVIHAVMFGGFALTLCFDLSKTREGFRWSWYIPVTATLLSTITGIIIEWLQDRMGLGRTYDNADILADFAGALLFSAIVVCWVRMRRSRSL